MAWSVTLGQFMAQELMSKRGLPDPGSPVAAAGIIPSLSDSESHASVPHS